MGAVAIDAMLKATYYDYQSLFLTYYTGYRFLKSLEYPVVDLLDGNLQIGQSAFCTPFGLETKKCVAAIEQFQPDLIINDGEPYLIEVTRDILKLPALVLAHPADLYSSANSKLAIDLFRYFYSKADLVMAHGLGRIPPDQTRIGGKAGTVIETNTIIRDRLYQQTLVSQPEIVTTSPFVVGVLGGGSQNVSSQFQAGTATFGAWMIQACNELGIHQATLYCADRAIYQTLKTIPSPQTALKLVADPIDNSTDIIQADLVIGRAGRNLLSELIALGKRGIVVPVNAEKFRAGNQLQTAEMAVNLNPNLHLALVQEGYDAFRDTLRRAIAANYQTIHWQPGNATALAAIQEFLSRR